MRNNGEPGCGCLYSNRKSTENLRETQKDDNLLKTKRILKPKYKLSEVLFFTFSRPGESKSPLIPPASYSTATNTLNIN